MPKISEILGKDRFEGLIAAGASDDELVELAQKERRKQLNIPEPTKTGNYLLDNDNLYTQTVRGLADTGMRLTKALDFGAESIGFDLVSDETTDYINKSQEKIAAAKDRVSQKGLSKERLAEISTLQDQSQNAKGTVENIKAGVNQVVDLATHPEEWTTQGVVETLVDPLNAISFGAGGIAARTAKTILGKAAVGAGVGAAENAVVNSGYEYAVARGGNQSEEEAQKIALQSAAGGAVAGAAFGSVGGVAFKDKKAAALKDKSAAENLDNNNASIHDEMLDNPLLNELKNTQAEDIANTQNQTPKQRPTSIMSVAKDILKDEDIEIKNKAIAALDDETIYKELPKAVQRKVDDLKEYEAYQNALDPNNKKDPNPLDELQKILSPQEIKKRMKDTIDSLPEVKDEDIIEINNRVRKVEDAYKKGKILEEDYKPDFILVNKNLPATLRELVDTEIIDPKAAAQIEYKNKILQLSNKGVIYSNFEGWSENLGQHIVDAINAKKINDMAKVELESNKAIESSLKIETDLINEGATPGQIKEVINKRFLPTVLESKISKTLNDGQPIENRYSGLRLRELAKNTLENLENPDINDLKIKLDNANIQPDLQKAIIDTVVNKDINILDSYISEKLTTNLNEQNNQIKNQIQQKLIQDFKDEDIRYQNKLTKINKNDFNTYKFRQKPKDFVVDDLVTKINNYVELVPGIKEFLQDEIQVNKIKEISTKFDDDTLTRYLPEEKRKLDLIRAVEAVENLTTKPKEIETDFNNVTKMLIEGC